jgi:hypothetical protein
MFGNKRKHKKLSERCQQCDKHVSNYEYNTYDADLKVVVNFCNDECRNKFYKK